MEILQEQLNAVSRGKCFAVLTVAESEGTSPFTIGKKMLLLDDGRTFGSIGGGELERQVLAEAACAIRNGKSFFKRYHHVPTHEEPGLGCSFKASILVEVVVPRPQLVVCGAGHVGGALLTLARQLNFETVLIDTRDPDQIRAQVNSADRFIPCESYEAGILGAEIFDGACYVCCASTHTQDKSALKGALQKNFGYVGMMGSVKKSVEIFRQLEQEGISRELLERVHAPIGLDICNMSPPEVAFSIMAEILMVKNGGTGKPRKSLTPDHRQRQKE